MYETVTHNEKEFRSEIQRVVDMHQTPKDCLGSIARNRYRASLNTHRGISAQHVADELISCEIEYVAEERRWQGELWYYT